MIELQNSVNADLPIYHLRSNILYLCQIIMSYANSLIQFMAVLCFNHILYQQEIYFSDYNFVRLLLTGYIFF